MFRFDEELILTLFDIIKKVQVRKIIIRLRSPDDHTNNPDNHNNPTDRTIQKTISLRGLPFKPLKPLQLLIHISSTAILAIIIFKPVNTTMLYRLIKTDIYKF